MQKFYFYFGILPLLMNGQCRGERGDVTLCHKADINQHH